MVNGIVFGVAFALAAVGVSWLLGPTRGRGLLAVLLAAAAAVYVGATLGDQPGSAGLATAALVGFGALAIWGLERADVLAFGWLAHGVWDLLHVMGGLVSGVPFWYEVACLVADPLIAGFLFYQAGQIGQEMPTGIGPGR